MDKASSKSVHSTRGVSFIKLAVLSAGLALATTTVSSAQSFDPEYGTGNVAFAAGWGGGVAPLSARAAYYGTDRASAMKPAITPRSTRVSYQGARRK